MCCCRLFADDLITISCIQSLVNYFFYFLKNFCFFMFSETIISDSSIRLPHQDTSVNYFFHFFQNINSFLFQNFKCRGYVSPLRNFFSDFPAAPRRGSVFCGLRNFRLLFLLSNALFSSDLRFPPTFFRGK